MKKRELPPGAKIVEIDIPDPIDVIKGLEELRRICTPKQREIVDKAIRNVERRQSERGKEEQT